MTISERFLLGSAGVLCWCGACPVGGSSDAEGGRTEGAFLQLFNSLRFTSSSTADHPLVRSSDRRFSLLLSVLKHHSHRESRAKCRSGVCGNCGICLLIPLNWIWCATVSERCTSSLNHSRDTMGKLHSKHGELHIFEVHERKICVHAYVYSLSLS